MNRIWPAGARSRALSMLVTAVAVVAAVSAIAAPASAIPTDPEEGCLSGVSGRISSSSTAVTVGASVQLTWTAEAPTNCGVRLSVTDVGTGAVGNLTGSAWVVPTGLGRYKTYELRAATAGASMSLAAISVRVNWPAPEAGRTTVRIDWNSQVEDFVTAVQTPNTTVLLADDLNLDLTGRGTLHAAYGVHIVGRRSSTTLGPRLFTRATGRAGPQPLIAIGTYHNADGVRIAGVRIDGGDMGIYGGGTFQDDDRTTPVAIAVSSSVNVEIADSEIYGWSGTAVEIHDPRERLGISNPSAVWVHDNYIHHNQRYRRLGYGVATKDGAYALIERNVFDYNRHALESSGAPGTGYRAYHNLVLSGGGVNSDTLFVETHTHQFDVHGTQSCGGLAAYCGAAGEYFDYRYNTLLYVNGDVVKVRGEPSLRAHVTKNVFVKGQGAGAVGQTQGTNVKAWNNAFGASTSTMFGPSTDYVCDFDGDGNRDHFLATGTSWWFLPSGVGTYGYFYLNTSGKMASELTFIQAGNRCDIRVTADGSTFVGGRGEPAVNGVSVPAARTDLVWQPPASRVSSTEMLRVWGLNRDLTGVERNFGRVFATNLDQADVTGTLLGTGDFNADGATDLLWRDESANVWIQFFDRNQQYVHSGRSLRDVAFPLEWAAAQLSGSMPHTTQLAGIGDLNADGRADVLWRKENGQLVLWFAGEAGNSTLVNRNNDLDVDENGIGRQIEVPVPLEWQVKGIGDFNGDGFDDILWQHTGSAVSIWYMERGVHVGEAYAGGTDPANEWVIQGIGDFNGDKHDDILWRHTAGGLAVWGWGLYDNGWRPSWQNTGAITGQEWQVKTVADFSGDGNADILWRHRDSGAVVIWKMNAQFYTGESALLAMDPGYELRGLLSQEHQRLDLQ